MRTKLFFAFLIVILIALISNLIFERFIVSDFEDYVSGAKEDQLYWVLASVEGSYSQGRWDRRSLRDAVRWATMLGFEVKIADEKGDEVMTSGTVISMLPAPMKRRMEGIVDLNSARGKFEHYPLYVEGNEIGTIYTRRVGRVGTLEEKEAIFKKRGKEFLLISFAIAGGGAFFMSVIFSLFLSRPLNRMKKAVESLARGDFSVRLRAGSKKDELEKLAASFNFMAEALEREEALRRHLTSNVAHELRTPLSVMKANVEAMLDGIVEDRGQGLDNIRMEVEKLISLVEGIEDMAKAEASFFSGSEYTEVNLKKFVSDIAAKMAPLATGKGLRLDVAAERTIHVVTDSGKLEKIVQNLVSNAIKNTDSGGVTIKYGTDKEMFYVEVGDSGAGIPDDKLNMIFRRFYRGEDSKGIGLGLAIVKELVDVLGGRIDLKSKVGEGTVFRIWLPVGRGE